MPLGNNIFISSEVCFYAFLGRTSRTTFRTKLVFSLVLKGVCLIPEGIDKIFPLWPVGMPVFPLPSVTLTVILPAPSGDHSPSLGTFVAWMC